MNFNPGIKIGDTITNKELTSIFQCGNMGGMRRSKSTGTLVIISDETKGLYKDIWKNGVLHYTGMGKVGDQVLAGNQNKTLYESATNGVEVHLFEVLKKAVYTYRGVVVLADSPYQTQQEDDNGSVRTVWIFPVMPVEAVEGAVIREPSEQELRKCSDEELARRASVKLVGKKARSVDQVVYYRDPAVKEMVKRIADGKCQFCGEAAPFEDKNGVPYLEEHHVIRLADGGTDSIDNVVAICPNCHRKMHVLDDPGDKKMLLEIARNNGNAMERMLWYGKKLGTNK